MKKYIVDSIGPIKKGDEIVFNPATFADNSNKAVLEYQLSGQVSVPNVKEMMKLAYTNKNFFFRSMGSIFNGKVSEGIVNAWAYLTLIPRLGIRSVLEEIMMFGLVAPLKSIQFYIGSGFKTSAALRIIKNTHGGYFDPQGLGLFTRIYFQVLKRGATKDYIQRAKNAKSPEEIADLVAELAFSRRILPRTKNYERDAQYIKDWVQHGWGRRAWEDVTIGGSYGVRNEVLVQKAIGSPKEVARIHGDVAPFFADKDAANRKFGRKKEFEQINFQYEDDAYFYSLNNEIVRRVEFGGETAKIAIRYMENPSKAVEEIAKYLRRNKGIRDRFANAYGSKGVDTNKLANSIYWATREPFAARNGSISKGILNLVRKKDAKGKLVFNSDIDFNALTALKAEELPQTLLSQKYVPVVETDGGLIKNIVDKGYGWMDRQISMMAREPMFFANYRYFRQELDGFEKLRFNQLVEKGYDEKTAQELASKWAAEQATDLAGKRTLDFVDNPLVRTNLAFTLRNFARFYRATEDFYRRAYRATFKNPQSIIRLRLAADGLDHSGFIYNDDNGDKYFVFPGDQVINAVFSKVTWLLNRETPSEVMPLEFTGKVKFLTPSLDPESAIPTLSGPVSGVSILILRNLMPKHWAIRDRLTETTLGPRGKNVTYLDVIMPSNVKRFYNTFLDQNEIDSQWASAARKAATALEAQGDGLSIDATEEEKLAYQKRIEAIATNIIVSRFFLGLVSPVSPQIGIGADVPEYLKDLGNVNFKAEFNKLVGEIAATGNPDPYNEAVIRWDKLNPGLLAYKVSETDLDKLATVRKTKEAAQWLRKNKDLVDKYPEGSLFFVPNSGTFDFDEFEFLEQEGYIQYIPVKDFIMAVSVVDEKQAYYTLVNKWDEQIQGSNPAIQSVLRKQAAAEKEKFLNGKPLLKRELSTGQNRQLIEDAFEDLRRMIESGDAPQTSLTVKYREMIDTFDKADSMINMLVFDTADMRFKKDTIRNSTYERLQKIAQGDPQAEAIVRTIFKDLLGV